MFDNHYGLESAVLYEIKTMTRRIMPSKLNEILNRITEKSTLAIPIDAIPCDTSIDEIADAFAKGDNKIVFWAKSVGEEIKVRIEDYMPDILQCAQYQVGEVVAIAQSYKDAGYDEDTKVRCKGQWHTIGFTAGWENKMFVRADEMPHQIQITDVKLERLQDITDEDCRKEGIQKLNFDLCDFKGVRYSYGGMKGDITRHLTPRGAFHELICKLSGKNIWIDNPYVFVYSFKLIK